LAAVALDRHAPDQVPGDQLLERIGDIRASEPERCGDVLGGERPFRRVEQCVGLADRAGDAPLAAHLAPVQDESAEGERKPGLFVNFCHDRNIGNYGRDVKHRFGRAGQASAQILRIELTLGKAGPTTTFAARNGEMHMPSLLKRFVADESAATAIEYGLICAGIAAVILDVIYDLVASRTPKLPQR